MLPNNLSYHLFILIIYYHLDQSVFSILIHLKVSNHSSSHTSNYIQTLNTYRHKSDIISSSSHQAPISKPHIEDHHSCSQSLSSQASPGPLASLAAAALEDLVSAAFVSLYHSVISSPSSTAPRPSYRTQTTGQDYSPRTPVTCWTPMAVVVCMLKCLTVT